MADLLAFMLSGGAARPIKSFGRSLNPITEWFMGSQHADPDDFVATDEGLVRGYLASLWAARCIRLRAHKVASIPLEVKTQDDEYVDKSGRPVKERVSSMAQQHILQRLVGQRSKRAFRHLEYDQCIWGRGFIEPARSGLFRLNPSTVEVLKSTDSGLEGFRQTIGGRVLGEWNPKDLLYFYDYDPADDLSGLSPLAFALRTVGSEVSIADYVMAYFTNDATPAGLLTTEQPIHDDEIQRAKAWWEKLFKGVKKKHSVGIVGNGLKFEKIADSMDDMALSELRLEVRREVCAAFGVPMTIAGADEAANYSTSSTQYAVFYTETIIPEVEMIVDVLNEQLVPRFGDHLKIVAELSDIEALQESKNDLAQRAFQGWTQGVCTLNEARFYVDQPPLEEDYINIPSVGPVRVEDLPLLARRAVAGNPQAFGESGGIYNPENTAPPKPPEPPAPAPGTPDIPPAPPAGGGGAAGLPDQPSRVQSLDITPAQSGYVPDKEVTMGVRHTNAWDPDLKTVALDDLRRFRKKVLSKGKHSPFKSTAIPTAVLTFLRWDLADAGDDDTAIKAAFSRAASVLKAADPTPEEFQAYWDGIDGVSDTLLEQIAALLDDAAWREQIAQAIQDSANPQAVQLYLEQQTPVWVEQLIGTEEQPGPLAQVFLAGAARGQELYDRLQKLNAPPAPIRALGDPTFTMTTAWSLVNKDARAAAQAYAYDLVRGMNQTTMTAFQEAMADWIQRGGSMTRLTDALLGRLRGLDIPAGWSPAKIAWATSRERARVIAQTESTRVFNQGNIARWQQLGVQEIRWRTQNDRDVCNACRDLGKEPWNLGTVTQGFMIPDEHQGTVKMSTILRPPLHVHCRCFTAPVTASRLNPGSAVSPTASPRTGSPDIAIG